MNLILGKYEVRDGEGKLVPCPLIVHKGWKHATVN